MRAIVAASYGMPEQVMSMQEVEKPSPKENEVLIRIVATAINDYDWSLARGKPYLYRLMFGLMKPTYPIFGMELSGVVEASGANAERFEIGDEVYGDISEYGFGTFAEYICVDENAVLLKPAELSFEKAAAIPHAALLAQQALQNHLKGKSGQQILVNGAGGGVGAAALYLAKICDGQVTGVDSGEKLEGLRKMGYDHVIDYRNQDFTRNGKTYDLILDCKTNRSPFSYLRSLKANGTYVTVGGKLTNLASVFFWGMVMSFFSNKSLQILALKPNVGLKEISAGYEMGKLHCLIDGPYDFEEIPELVQYFGEGKHKGKVVVKIS